MAATTMRRSAYGLGTIGDDWRQHAACKETAHLHTADLGRGHLGPDSPQAKALHVCRRHCPALAKCDEAAQEMPPRGIVQAGQIWAEANGRALPKSVAHAGDPGCGDWCAHLRKEA